MPRPRSRSATATPVCESTTKRFRPLRRCARPLPGRRWRRLRGASGCRLRAARARSRLDRTCDGLSGGEAARVSLAAVLLLQADLVLLDEPTNDLDADGLERLERFVDDFPGALVVVSHDRAFLDRTVDADRRDRSAHARDHRVGGRLVGLRAPARRGTRARVRRARGRAGAPARADLAALAAPHGGARPGARARREVGRRRPARHARAADEGAPGRAAARAEPAPREAVRAVGAAARAAGRRPAPDACRSRSPAPSSERGAFRLGPLDLELLPGERLAVTGRERHRQDDARPGAARRGPARAGRRARSGAASSSA